jgi:hypothetical protein
VAEVNASKIQGEARLRSFAAALMARWRHGLLCCGCGRVERAKRGKMASEGGSSGSVGRVKERSRLQGPFKTPVRRRRRAVATRLSSPAPSRASAGEAHGWARAHTGQAGPARLMGRIGGARPTKERKNIFFLFFKQTALISPF